MGAMTTQLSWIDSTQDPRYRAVLDVRRQAYVHEGKVPATVGDETLADEFDRDAKIGVLSVETTAIGTIRMCLTPDKIPCDYARHRSFAEVSTRYGPFVTGSRMAVLPAYQGKGLFRVLHDVMPKEAERVSRQYVVGSAAGWVLEQYVKAGWIKTGCVYEDPDFGGMPHEFIVLDVREWRRRHPL